MSGLVIQLKGRAGAISVLAVMGLVTLALFAFALSRLLAWAEGDTNAALHRLAVYHAEAAARPRIEAELKQALIQAAHAPGLLQGTSAALAQATLESDIKAIAKDNGADVRSADILPVDRVRDFEVISIQYDLSVPMSRLRDLTYAIESHTPYLFIDHVVISGGQGFEAENNAPRDPSLDVRWTVHGYRWAAKS